MIPANNNGLGLDYETGNYSCDNCAENVDMFDKETLRSYIEMWSEWKERTGGKVICNEFAVSAVLPKEVRTEYMTDLLELLDENKIPWSLYTSSMGEYGPLHKCYKESFYALPNLEEFELHEDYAVDIPLMEVLKQHMQ